jgi:hypothetical protein
MKNSDLTCNHCGLINDYRTEKRAMHLAAICNGCDKHIKFLPQEEPRFHFGKYKGTEIRYCTDANYLMWAIENKALKGRYAEAAQQRISQL